MAFLFMAAGICLRMAGCPPPAAILIYVFTSLGSVFGIIFGGGRQKTRKYRKYRYNTFFFRIFIFLILFFIGYFSTYIHDSCDSRLTGNIGGEVCFGGTVAKVSTGTYSCRIFLEDCTLHGRKILNNAVLEVENSEAEKFSFCRGDYLEGRGILGCAAMPENPGQFDMRAYYKALGYTYYIKNPGFTTCERSKNPVITMLEKIKRRLKEVYRLCCSPRDAGVFEAVVLGDKSEMDETLSELFSAGGIGHILAISGLHISILGMGIYKLLRRIGAGYLLSALLGGAFVVLYGIMTGNSVSTVRAVVMFVCAVYAKIIGRTYDILSAAALAGILLLIDNPYCLAGGGFLLSFLAVAGISVVSEGFLNKKERRQSSADVVLALSEKLSGPIAIQFATLPVLLWFYYEIPVYSCLLNLVVVPLMTLLMISALLTGAAGCFSLSVGRFFSGTAHYLLLLFEKACGLTLSLPGSVFVAGRPRLWQIGAYAAGVLIFSQRHKLAATVKKKRAEGEPEGQIWPERLIRGAGTAVLLLSLAVLLYRDRTGLEAAVLSVGQGDGIYINMPDGTVVFIDGGSSSKDNVYEQVIELYLKYKGVRQIDYLFITHNDSDHYSGWLKTASGGTRLTVKRLILNEADYERYRQEFGAAKTEKDREERKDSEEKDIFYIAEAMERAGTEVAAAAFGTEYCFGGARLICVSRREQEYGASDNDASTVLLLRYNGMNALFTGDISEKREEELAEELEKRGVAHLNFLKVAHHGSRYSTSEEFLKRLTPDIAAVSCGRFNYYGHPHKEVLQRLTECGTAIYQTPKGGAVIFKVHKGRWEIRSAQE